MWDDSESRQACISVFSCHCSASWFSARDVCNVYQVSGFNIHAGDKDHRKHNKPFPPFENVTLPSQYTESTHKLLALARLQGSCGVVS